MGTARPPGLVFGVVCRQSLDDSVAGQHSSIDREVSADHERTHGRVFLGESVGFIWDVCLV